MTPLRDQSYSNQLEADETGRERKVEALRCGQTISRSPLAGGRHAVFAAHRETLPAKVVRHRIVALADRRRLPLKVGARSLPSPTLRLGPATPASVIGSQSARQGIFPAPRGVQRCFA